MDRELARRQIAQIAEIGRIGAELGVQVWLRGGWAMDFWLGELTRDHRDIDLFAWSLDADAIERALLQHGFVPEPVRDRGLQRDFVRDGLDSSVALVGRDRVGRFVVPAGPYAGEVWPDDLLHPTPARLDGVEFAVVGPRAQLEIKQMMPIWVPGMPRRPKDAADIARLQAALDPRIG